MLKKRKVIFCLVLLFCTIIIPIYSLNAAPKKKSGVTFKQITEAEFEQYDLSDWVCTEYESEVAIPTQIPNK